MKSTNSLDYNTLRNLVIYETLRKVDAGYLKKAVPDYLNDERSYLDIAEVLKINRLGATSCSTPFLKIFFAEATIQGKRYYRENYLSEKMAIIEICLDFAQEYYKQKGPENTTLLSKLFAKFF